LKRHRRCVEGIHAHDAPEKIAVDLIYWIPATLALGALALSLMYAFVEACDWV
jgi:hypothetical protein